MPAGIIHSARHAMGSRASRRWGRRSKARSLGTATADNGVADDNQQSNGLSSKLLLSAMSTPGLDLKQIFERTKQDVFLRGIAAEATPLHLRRRDWALLLRRDGAGGESHRARLPGRLQSHRRPRAEIRAGTVKIMQDGLPYVWIPRGRFQMGCSEGDSECDKDEKPLHQVTITKGFWIGRVSVTAGSLGASDDQSKHYQRAAAPGRVYHLERCEELLREDRPAAADGGGVGVRRARAGGQQ